METAIVGVLVVLTQLGAVWVSHIKGKRGNLSMDGKLNRLGQDLRTAIDVNHGSLSGEVSRLAAELKTDIATLSSHVIGPDGQNGLRGDVRRLERDLSDIAPRKLGRRRA